MHQNTKLKIIYIIITVSLVFVMVLIPSFHPTILIKSNSKSHPYRISEDSLDFTEPLLVINQTFGGPEQDRPEQIIECSAGGFAIIGSTRSFGAIYQDVWLLRVDINGHLLWNQTYGDYGNEEGQAIVECTDGGFAIAGSIANPAHSDYDAWLIRTDDNGQPLWNKTYGSINDDQAIQIIKPKGGGFLIAGYTDSWGAGQKDAWLIRTDNGGNQLWQQTYGGTLDDYGNGVIECSTGGFALIGSTENFGMGAQDIWLIRTDHAGIPIWNQTYGGPNHDAATECIELPTGGFAIAGQTESLGAGLINGYLIRTDAMGTPLWDVVIYDGTLWGICPLTNGELLATGRKYIDLVILQTNSTGSISWEQTYGGTEIDAGQSILAQSPTECTITGRTNSYGNGAEDIWLLQIQIPIPPPTIPTIPIPGFPSLSIILGILIASGITIITKRKNQ